ncbi:MAG: MBL fold metallo-hydrolase [Bacteroidetes bacterium]|nr:MBL fold metallo-hydrolase [Bacteroidota bacterium]
MVNLDKAVSENISGQFFVDDTCINCGACRHYSPEVFSATETHSYVKKQPFTEAEFFSAKEALLSCPVAAIGSRVKQDLKNVLESFPKLMSDNIYLNGFNDRKTFGAHSYFIKNEQGNWLIDAPRFSAHLIKKFEEMGGIDYIFLSHKDDVGDADKYAKHFHAKRIIHEKDANAAQEAEIIVQGDSLEIDLAKIYWTRGHTLGHMVMLWDNKYLFTGDHFCWSSRYQKFYAFRTFCWDSWAEQIKTVDLLKQFTKVEFVFPGHGKWHEVEKEKFPEIIQETVKWMISVK